MKDKLQRPRWKWLWLAAGLTFVMGLLLVLSMAVFGADPGGPAELALFFGRFHPLLVHLPIGFFVLAVLLEVFSRHPRFGDLRPATTFVLVLCAASALLSVGAGLLLAGEGGYEASLLGWHKWLGIAVAVAVVGACVLKIAGLRQPSAHVGRAYTLVLVGAAGLLGVASHYGGSLTHGTGYLTHYMPGPLRSLVGLGPRDARPVRFANIEEAVLYEDLVRPILEARCVDCHNPNKRKGQLELDTPEGIRAGGEDGPVVVAGRPLESELVRRILLPPEHEDAMPPDGRASLSPAEAELLQWWVEAGAEFDQTVGEAEAPPSVEPMLAWLSGPPQPQGVFALEIPPPDSEAVAHLRSAGVQVMPLSDGSPLLEVRPGTGADFGGAELEALLPLSEQVTWLDLGGTAVTDTALAVLGRLPHLTRLHLENTKVSDAGLRHLQDLAFLSYLNLYGTGVTDAGLTHLTGLEELEQVYLWQTAVTEEGARRLREARPDLEVNLGWQAPPAEPAPVTPAALD